jgi:hypothetical protein
MKAYFAVLLLDIKVLSMICSEYLLSCRLFFYRSTIDLPQPDDSNEQYPDNTNEHHPV